MSDSFSSVRGLLIIASVVLAIVTVGGAWTELPVASAQIRGDATVPGLTYFGAMAELLRGEYQDAERLFNSELRGGTKIGQSRWIDSICYLTMLGECHYYAGQYRQSLEHYDHALQLYLAYPDWMIRVQFRPTVAPDTAAQARRTPPWGRSSRGTLVGRFNDSDQISMGRLDNTEVAQRGGVIQPATLYVINAPEIVRCIAQAIRRRNELLGPVAKHDKLAGQLVTELSRRPGRPNHWSEAWIDLLLGVAYSGTDNVAQAKQYLTRSLLVDGRYDHPMTAMAFVELGQLEWKSGNLAAAARMFEEASYAAFYFSDFGILEDALRFGQRVHLIAGRPGVYPPLAVAASWAQANRARQLQASLVLLLAENTAVQGSPQEAAGMLGDVRKLMGRADMARGPLGAQWSYLSALVNFQLNRPKPADEALSSALAFGKAGSKWQLQVQLADERYLEGVITHRIAVDLYRTLLRDPGADDWTHDPLESHWVMLVPNGDAFQHWFEAALRKKDVPAAVEIADLARRRAFHSSLPLGGRLLALRSVLETPTDELPQQVALQRQGLLDRYPSYGQLAQQVREIRTQLAGRALVSDPAQDQQDIRALLDELVRLSEQQEAILREIALRCEPADLIFPPKKEAKQLVSELPEGQALLAFFSTGRQIHGLLLQKQDHRFWSLDSPNSVRQAVQNLLREMGNHDPNRELNLAAISNNNWMEVGSQLVDRIFQRSKVDLRSGINELVIVPDDVLWYVPFEALPLVDAPGGETVLTQMRVRYAPTASLAFPGGRQPSRGGSTAVVLGKLFPRDDPAIAEEAFQKLLAAVPDAISLKAPLQGPSPVIGTFTDTLIVLNDITPGAPYAWSPIALDRTPAAGALGQWLTLPWGGPQRIILPGFHTAAETSLRRKATAAPGSEIFLTVCGLMSCGARTILISRWRTGGQTSFDLVREFVQELPHIPAADAWQRSVQLSMVQPIRADREPRLKEVTPDRAPTAAHPFFWAGYLLVDTGEVPPAEEPPAEEPPQEDAQPAVRIKEQTAAERRR